jgi:hypothetical protein
VKNKIYTRFWINNKSILNENEYEAVVVLKKSIIEFKMCLYQKLLEILEVSYKIYKSLIFNNIIIKNINNQEILLINIKRISRLDILINIKCPNKKQITNFDFITIKLLFKMIMIILSLNKFESTKINISNIELSNIIYKY